MIGTAEERRARRDARNTITQEKNAAIQAFGGVNPGTRALFVSMRKTRGESTDKFLFTILRAAQRHGF